MPLSQISLSKVHEHKHTSCAHPIILRHLLHIGSVFKSKKKKKKRKETAKLNLNLFGNVAYFSTSHQPPGPPQPCPISLCHLLFSARPVTLLVCVLSAPPPHPRGTPFLCCFSLGVVLFFPCRQGQKSRLRA